MDKETMLEVPVTDWTIQDSIQFLIRENLSSEVITICEEHKVNGKCLLAISESDLAVPPLNTLSLGDRKCFFVSCKVLQRENQAHLIDLGLQETGNNVSMYSPHNHYSTSNSKEYGGEYCESERISPSVSDDGKYQRLPPEKIKAFYSFCYLVLVTWITAFVMVIVHERVPDMKKYPPLPDIFLDNVPHIPWAFDMCEVTGSVLFAMWVVVLFFHKHRFILMRRFFALSGTVFLLRCVTMLITSLSVPGAHLQCKPPVYSNENIASKLAHAYTIWSGAGMSIQGVRTCGDYMFSGHTVALTMLNFFITEYTPRHIYYIHTLSWMLNMFGVFFILAAHEHYSIDVFVAFYITSRLFLYYHTLSNNQALMQRDSNRTKVWFPLFSYFESGVDGIVPNEYETLHEIMWNLTHFVKIKVVWLKNRIVSILVPKPIVIANGNQQKIYKDKAS